MSARFNIALTFSVLAVMLLTSTVIIYFTKENRDSQERTEQFAIQAREQSEHNNRDIEALNQTVNGFIDMWEKRIKTSNTINNSTQQKIENAVTNILGNLTSHRIVANETNSEVSSLQNSTNQLIIKFNQTNEAERAKAVSEIINAVNNNTKILKEFLGVNKTGIN